MRLFCSWEFSGENTGVGCHFLHHGIFLTQRLNLCLLCLLHCRCILYPLSLCYSILPYFSFILSYSVLFAMLHGLWGLSFPTRDGTHALGNENRVLTTGRLAIPRKFFIFKLNNSVDFPIFRRLQQPPPPSSSKTFSSPQKETLCPVSSRSHSHRTPGPWQ